MRNSGSRQPVAPGRGERIVLRILVTLAVLVAGGTGASILTVTHYENQLHRVAITGTPGTGGGLVETSTPPEIIPPLESANFLLVGSDTRDGRNGAFASADISGARSDTVILAHLPAGGGRPTLISFPRDSYVRIPAWRDTHGKTHPATHNKLNAAYAIGGPALLVATIEGLTRAHIDHYVGVDFVGFQHMVDALGGITLCARTSRNDPANGPMGGSDDFMSRGTHPNVSGKVALAFVRDRHSFPDQDFGRIRDQQYFISQMIHKVVSAGTLTNPVRLNAFLNALTRSVTVDESLGLAGMETLAARLRHTDSAHVRFLTPVIANDDAHAEIDGYTASIVLLNDEANALLFAHVLGDTPGGTNSPTPTPTATTTRAPSPAHTSPSGAASSSTRASASPEPAGLGSSALTCGA